MAIFVALLVPTLVVSMVALCGLLIYGGGIIFFQPKQEEEDTAFGACSIPGNRMYSLGVTPVIRVDVLGTGITCTISLVASRSYKV